MTSLQKCRGLEFLFHLFYKTVSVAAFTFALILSLGCGRDELPKYTKLDRLRVLAITTPTPEIQSPAGGIVNVDITPYFSDIGGSGNITLSILSRLDPGTLLGVPPSCEGQAFVSTLQTVSVTAPPGQADGIFGSPERTGAPSTGAITVGLNVPAGLLAT